MRDVAIVSFEQHNAARELRNEVEILLPIAQGAIANSACFRAFWDFTATRGLQGKISRKTSAQLPISTKAL